jgi:hypothetical protein
MLHDDHVSKLLQDCMARHMCERRRRKAPSVISKVFLRNRSSNIVAS